MQRMVRRTRDRTHAARSPRLFANGWAWIAVTAALVLHAAMIDIPVLQRAFRTVDPGVGDWRFCILAASSVLWIREITTAMTPAEFVESS
jgi:hypothetical protein